MEEQKKLPEDFWTAPVDVDPLAQNPDVGADLTQIEDHQTELGGIVEKMWQDMVNECVVLEGTDIPEREEIVIPREDEEEVLKRIKELSIEEESKD
jgi:hypothetical protein